MRKSAVRKVCVLLPNKQRLVCTVGSKSRGRDVLDQVLVQLDLRRLQIFGLATLKDNEYLFIDLEQTLAKYLGKSWRKGSEKSLSVLFLRVQFYIENGRLIHGGELQLYYAALRQKVLRSLSRQQEVVFFQLAARALQAEHGDLEIQGPKHKHYFLPEDYFPSWLIKRRGRDYLLQHCPKLHQDLRGMTAREAVLDFVKLSNAVEDVPVTVYRMRREKKELKNAILFGVAAHGVCLHQDVEGKQFLLHQLHWKDVEQVTFQRSRFSVRAVGSLCLPLLRFHCPSSVHAALVHQHLRDLHRFSISVRNALSRVRQMEEAQATRLCREVYICDTMPQCLTSSMTDRSTDPQTGINREEDEQNQGEVVPESEEVFVDGPDEVSWLTERFGISVDGPLVLPSSDWTAVSVEMKQVLERRADTGLSVDKDEPNNWQK